MLVHAKKVTKRELIKEGLKNLVYIIKSYLKIEPCAYCGKEKDPEIICHRCMPK